MTDAARRLMEADEFLLWCQTQEDSYELVDGVPVPKYRDSPEAMAGTTRNHARIATNIARHLGNRLSGGPCVALNDQLSVRTSARKLRRPDVVVECGIGSGDDLEVAEPTVLFEVLSPSSERDDLVWKPEEYKRLDSVQQYVAVYPDEALLKVWTREADGRWGDGMLAGLASTLVLPALGTELPLAEVYESVELRPA
jgi:Uma2 family endonuclease